MASRIRLSIQGIAAGPQRPIPASFEPSSGWAALAAAVPSPTGVQAQSGWRLKVSELGLKLIGLIHRPSFIGAIASRTAANRSSGKRGGNLPRGSGCSGGIGLPVARGRLPAVVEDESLHAEPAGDRSDLPDRGEVHVVLGAGRDPVVVGAVGVERD